MVRAFVWLGAMFALAFSGCGEPVDLTRAIQIVDVSSGWRDAGVVNGQNKLVPSITFRIRNASAERLPILQVNALFRRVNEGEEWGSGFMTVAGSDGLAPGASSQMLTISSQLGYTGIEPEQLMMQNSQFVDAKVQLFTKYGSVQWVRVAEIGITRRLIGR
jgi:hypothetical protein